MPQPGPRHYVDPQAAVDPTADLEEPVKLGPRVEVLKNTRIGRFSYLNPGTVVYPRVTIGRFCSIGRDCHLGVARHPTDFLSTHPFQRFPLKFPDHPDYAGVRHVKWKLDGWTDTMIGSDVWIGTHALVHTGVTVGAGAVIGANAVVVRDVRPYAIVAGSPAKEIRRRFSDERVDALLALAWWELPLPLLADLPFADIDACIARLQEIRAAAAV